MQVPLATARFECHAVTTSAYGAARLAHFPYPCPKVLLLVLFCFPWTHRDGTRKIVRSEAQMLRIIFLLGSGGGFGRECAYSKGVREWEREYTGRNRVFRTLQIYSCQIVFSALWVWIICLRYTDKLWRRIDRYFELVKVCTHCCAVLQRQFYRRNMFLNCKIRGNMFQHSHYTKTAFTISSNISFWQGRSLRSWFSLSLSFISFILTFVVAARNGTEFVNEIKHYIYPKNMHNKFNYCALHYLNTLSY